MDGDLVNSLLLVCATRTLNRILGSQHTGGFLLAVNEWCLLAVRGIFEVKQEVGASTEDPTRANALVGDGFVLEDNAGNVNRVGVELGTGGDRVVTRLETGDRGDDDVEWDLPRRSVLGSGENAKIVTGSELENLSELQATVVDDVVVFLLVGVEVLEERLSLRGRSELG